MESKVRFKLTENEKEAEKACTLALSERIRRRNDVDFEMEKEQLAKELKNT